MELRSQRFLRWSHPSTPTESVQYYVAQYASGPSGKHSEIAIAYLNYKDSHASPSGQTDSKKTGQKNTERYIAKQEEL